VSGRTRRLVVRLVGCLLIAVGLTAFAALANPQGRFGRFEGIASDLAFPRGEIHPSVAVVAIDAPSVAELGTWPWPRTRHAEIIHRLDDLGARAIAYDVLFADPAPGDDQLADAIDEAGNVVLAAIGLPVGDDARTTARGVQRASLVVLPDQQVAAPSAGTGHTQVTPSPADGVIREVPLVVETAERVILPGLSLAAAAVAVGETVDPIVRRPSGVQVGSRTVPTDEDYELRVSYVPELSIDRSGGPIISAADLLGGRVDPETVRDRVVFVGVTDPSLGDRHITPVAKSGGLPGVLVHANAFDTMASRSYLDSASTVEVAMTVFVVALLVALATQFLPPVLAASASLAVLVAFLLGAYLRADAGVLVSFAFPVIAVIVAVPLSGAVRYVVVARQQRRVTSLFAQYVPERVAQQLIDEGLVETARSGQRSQVTVLFCDLRGFTALSARTEPAEVNDMLSHFYEYASRIVLEEEGTLMQYVGDEIFAVFGAPIAAADHATRGLAAARRMQESIDEFDADLRAGDHEVLRFGIGVNCGEVVAAHAGSTWRRQYTVIGDTVNVGSRLCSQAGPGQVVLSEAVRASVEPSPQVEPLGERLMKGVSADFLAWKLVLDKIPSGAADR
jgi:adenylate cyclase